MKKNNLLIKLLTLLIIIAAVLPVFYMPAYAVEEEYGTQDISDHGISEQGENITSSESETSYVEEGNNVFDIVPKGYTMSEKCLLDQWRDMAYDRNLSKEQLESFWGKYFTIETSIYEQLLDDPDTEVKGTVKELAEKYGQDVMTMVGFLDGINDSLKTPNPIETMDEDTEVSLGFDKEKLYKNMVDARADWLYELPQWEKIFDENTRKRLYKEQKNSGTIRKEKKIGRNDPCPCGSGKKYKKCCGRNA